MDVEGGVRAELFILGSWKSWIQVLPQFPIPLLNSLQPLFPPKQFHPCRRTPIIRKRLRRDLGSLPGGFFWLVFFWGNLFKRLILFERDDGAASLGTKS